MNRKRASSPLPGRTELRCGLVCNSSMHCDLRKAPVQAHCRQPSLELLLKNSASITDRHLFSRREWLRSLLHSTASLTTDSGASEDRLREGESRCAAVSFEDFHFSRPQPVAKPEDSVSEGRFEFHSKVSLYRSSQQDFRRGAQSVAKRTLDRSDPSPRTQRTLQAVARAVVPKE